MTEQRARLLASLTEHPGWDEFVKVRDEQESENRESIDAALLDTKTLTAAKVITLSAKRNRIQALRDLFDEIARAHKILTPNRRAGS